MVISNYTDINQVLCYTKEVRFIPRYAILNKVSYGSGQKCSKELKNHSFTSVETIVVKLYYSKKCAKINIFHVLNHKSLTT